MIKLRDIVLLEDFKSQAKKFIESGIDKGIVDSYIERFKKIRDAKPAIARTADIAGLKVEKGSVRFDIDKYEDFHQLEIFVDYVAGQVANISKSGKKFDKIEVDADVKPVVAANGLEVYYAKDKHACIKYRGGRPYSWCVSRSDSSNMYNTYRYKYNEPSFYFVKDVAATEEEFKNISTGTFKNPWHFFVVQSTNNPDQFIVTSAENDGDNPMSWEELVKIVPKLNGLRKYFTHVPLTQMEKDNYNRFMGHPISDEEFVKFSYEEKEAFLDIAIPNRELTTVQFASLPMELKNKFIGFGVGLTDEQYELIKKDKNLMKRYLQVSLRKYKEHLKNDSIHMEASEYDIILSTAEGVEIIRSAGDDEAIVLLKTLGSVKRFIEIFGLPYTEKMIKNNPVHFGANCQADEVDYVFSLFTDLTKRTITAYSLENSNSNIKSIDWIYATVNALVKYKGVLTIDDVHWLEPDDIKNSKEFAEYCLKLYQQGKTAKFDEDYYFFFARIDDFMRLYNIFGGEKVFNTSIKTLNTIGGFVDDDLRTLFIKNLNKDVNYPNRPQILSILGNVLKESNGYSLKQLLIHVPNNDDPNKLNETIHYLGGAAIIGPRLDAANIADILRFANPSTIDIYKTLFTAENLRWMKFFNVKDFLFMDNRPMPMEKYASVIGNAPFNNFTGSEIYFQLEKLDKNKKPEVEEFIDVLLKYKTLTYNVDWSDLATFLIFSNNEDKIFSAFGIDKIKSITSYDIWRVLTETIKHAGSNKAWLNRLQKILQWFGKDVIITHIKGGNLNEILSTLSYYSVEMKSIVLPYINDNLSIYNIAYFLGRTKNLSHMIGLIGVENVKKLAYRPNEIVGVIVTRQLKNISQTLAEFIPIFGKDYLKSIVYHHINTQLPPELLQEDHLSYRHYYE